MCAALMAAFFLFSFFLFFVFICFLFFFSYVYLFLRATGARTARAEIRPDKGKMANKNGSTALNLAAQNGHDPSARPSQRSRTNLAARRRAGRFDPVTPPWFSTRVSP